MSFLLTDIEASTRLWEEFPVQMAVGLARHDGIVRSAITERHGYVFGTAGDGFNAAFWTAREALDAAIAAQAALAAEAWPEPIGSECGWVSTRGPQTNVAATISGRR